MARILVVDDEELSAEILGMFLEDEGHEVRVASDAGTAQELIDSFKPEILIADYLLKEEVSGADLALRARKRDADAEIVLVSGLPRAHLDTMRPLIPGMHALTKPLDLDDITDLIQRAGTHAHPHA